MKSNNWKTHIPGCFGHTDKYFGSHQNDQGRAKAMYKAAIDDEATMSDIVHEATVYLKESGAGEQHINGELEKIRDLRFWDN